MKPVLVIAAVVALVGFAAWGLLTATGPETERPPGYTCGPGSNGPHGHGKKDGRVFTAGEKRTVEKHTSPPPPPETEKPPRPPGTPPGQRPQDRRKQLVERITSSTNRSLDRAARRTKLTDYQKKSVQDLVKERNGRIFEIRDGGGDREDINREVNKVIKEYDDLIRTELGTELSEPFLNHFKRRDPLRPHKRRPHRRPFKKGFKLNVPKR